MFLSIATTHQPATDLGYLLMKHPGRVHETEHAFGRSYVLFPEAGAERCEAVLLLEVDPIELVRGRGQTEGLLDQYVNDRPYAASSLLSVALNRVFRTAMAGTSRERQPLADSAIPLEITVRPLPAQGGAELVERLFAPLGWQVTAAALPTPAGTPSRYVALTIAGTLRLADALSHLYVLIPVLDSDKHYWVGDDEVDRSIDTRAGVPAAVLVDARVDGERVRLAEPQEAVQRHREGGIAAGVVGGDIAVHSHHGIAVHPLELDQDRLVPPCGRDLEGGRVREDPAGDVTGVHALRARRIPREVAQRVVGNGDRAGRGRGIRPLEGPELRSDGPRRGEGDADHSATTFSSSAASSDSRSNPRTMLRK